MSSDFEQIDEKQIGERTEYFQKYLLTTVSFIGHVGILSARANENRVGSKYMGHGRQIVKSSVLETLQANQAKWTCSYKTYLSGGGQDDDYENQTWQMSMTQYEYPLTKYLSADAAYEVASWRETDFTHRKEFKYLEKTSKEDGPVYAELSAYRAEDVAKKEWAGIESVLKFYPQATRTSIYSSKQTFSSRADALNHIDSTPDAVFGDFSVEWLKTGFDWTQNQDGTWTLTETWIGAPSWDKDLYGSNAWSFVDPQGN